MSDGEAGELKVSEVQLAIDRAHRVLWRSQRADGSWDTPGEVGAWVTAQVVTVLRYLRVLDEADTQGAARWLTCQQRPDGSFAMHPYATVGALPATACGWAALASCGASEAAERAARWVLQQPGGLGAVIDGMNEGDFAALFLSMAGLLDAKRLPCPSTTPLLVPPIRSFMQTRFHSGVLMGAFQTEFLVRQLRGDFTSGRGLLDRLKARAAIETFRTFQNEDGSWNDSTVISVLILPALAAIGTEEARAMLSRAVAWVNGQKLRDARGMHFAGFGTEVWATAFDVRALLAGGVPPADAELGKALEWLARAQLSRPMPPVDNRQEGMPRTGGWAFQRTNHTMPDCDDAGVVLSALGVALSASGAGALDAVRSATLREASERGRAWVHGMQNPDGGWSAFVWGLPGKKPGPMMQTNARVDMTSPLSMIEALIVPPPVTGDPSTEDLTGRVLHGLGMHGETVASSASVARAVEFLRVQQWRNGGWWGRWVVNYLSASAFVLMGLAAVKADLSQGWIRRGLDFLLSKQREDGGWGEGPESYVNEDQAGVGPTMLPLTALVVQALIDCGEGGSPQVEKAIRLLLRTQRNDGTWSNGEYLHTNVPPDTFYVYPEAARFYPTEALGKYLAFLQQPSIAVTPRVRWSNAMLDEQRGQMDPPADAVIAEVFAHGEGPAINALMGAIFRTDQPVPPGLPEPAAAYFEQTALPAWADRAQIALAQQLFTRAGWQVAMGLFCSSLPQAYAAARGAHVITQTQGMTRHVKQRIFETAQFLFDTLDEGALEPTGRGVRTIQKMRLMHAAVRHLLLTRKSPAWDVAVYGQPINQEDLAGTLMTFSVVTLDALKTLKVPVSQAEADAWLHTWKVIGSLLGVRDELLPTDLADGEQLMEAIRDRQWEPSADGVALGAALVDLMQSYFPGVLLDGVPVALIRTLAGDHCGDLLGLAPADWTQQLIRAGSELDELLGDGEDPTEKFLALATHRFMEGMVAAEREGKDAKFRIPPSLKKTVDPNA